jgi:hypothetical protein
MEGEKFGVTTSGRLIWTIWYMLMN